MNKATRRGFLLLTLAVAVTRCSGGSSGPSAPSAPAPSSGATVTIVGSLGPQAFQPNPVQTNGQPLVFRNSDGATHRLIMDDGSVDFGTLAPGASSAARMITGGNYHCTLHPSMVGNINGSAPPEPPPGSGPGY